MQRCFQSNVTIFQSNCAEDLHFSAFSLIILKLTILNHTENFVVIHYIYVFVGNVCDNYNNKYITVYTNILNTYSENDFLCLLIYYSLFCYRCGRTNVVQFLLTIPDSDPNCTDKNGHTPLALADETDTIKCLLKYGAKSDKMYSEFLPEKCMPPTPPAITVFMVGDKGAGKSTLTKALMTEKSGISRFTARLTKVGGVTARTAGIECHQIHSQHIGNLRIYDIAGHREFHSSHDTVIRSASSGGIFLFIIDLSANESNIQSTVFYWLSSLQNQVSSDRDESCKPHLLLIGSHADRLASKSDLKRKEELIATSCSSVSKLHVAGFLAVDCRHSESPSLAQLRRQIFEIQQSKQKKLVLTFHLHCFHIYLIQKCGNQPGVQLGTVVKCIHQEVGQDVSSPYLEFIPNDLSAARKSCIELSRRGIILYMQMEAIENSWVFVESEMLLKKVNGTIFAPNNFPEHKSLAIHTGVVPFKKICDHFRVMEETKHMEIELLLQFMIHMEVCREITDPDMLELLAIKYPDYKNDRHFLFPGLITESIEGVQNVTSAKELWQPTPGISYSPYNSCWVLKCRGIQHYFSSRFLEVLLLRLAFKHASPANPHDEGTAIPGFKQAIPGFKQAIPGFKQACTLWKNGIRWSSTSFIEGLVSVDDHQVAVLMRCCEGKEGALAHTRSQVIREIFAAKEEFCSSTETAELFIPNPTFPVNTDLSVPFANVTDSITRHEEGVITSDNTTLELLRLLHFEPYMYFPTECLFDLYSTHPQSHTLTQQFIEYAITSIGSAQNFCIIFSYFCTMLNVSQLKIESNSSHPYQQMKLMFQAWQEKTEGTFQCLREHMDKYSVFSGRNILVSLKCNLRHFNNFYFY